MYINIHSGVTYTGTLETTQKSIKFIWNHKKSQIAEAVLRKYNKAGGIHPPRLQSILQSYSNQNTMVLAQKQTHSGTE